MFIDIRDHFGITQCVIENKMKILINRETKPESVVSISGKVVKREKGTENKDISTGKIEISINKIKVLSEANELPMPVFGEQDYPEKIRLKYRFIDLRRNEMHSNIVLRSKYYLF